MSELVSEVVEGLLGQGADRLPAERQLADSFGVSRSRVRRELDKLEAAGIIVRTPGRTGGAFLANSLSAEPLSADLFDTQVRKVERDLDDPHGIPELLERQGYSHRTDVLLEEVVTSPSDEIARRLRIERGSPVLTLLRLRLADDEPLSLERMFVDARRFPDLQDHAPIRSMYALLEREYDTRVASVTETVDVSAASNQVASHLRIRAHTPVFVLRRLAFDEAGRPVETSVDIFRTDRTRLRVGRRWEA